MTLDQPTQPDMDRPLGTSPVVARALRAGIETQIIQAARVDAAQTVAPLALHSASADDRLMHSHVDTPTFRQAQPVSRVRRIGRRMLQTFRPLLLPLLHRFEWRVRTAVDKSGFAGEALRQLEANSQRLNEIGARKELHQAALLNSLSLLIDEMGAQRAQMSLLTDEMSAQRAQIDLVTPRLPDIERELSHVRQQLGSGHLLLERLVNRYGIALSATDFLIRTPYGWLLAPTEDERLIMAMLETSGQLERGTIDIVSRLLRPGDTMVDVGAHIGTITLAAARAVGPAGKVIAVEPTARSSALLRRSIHINSLAGTVLLHTCAAGRVPGIGYLYAGTVLGENSLFDNAVGIADHAPIPVQIRTLDDLVGNEKPRLVKIDVEGYELEVWDGMGRLIAQNPEIMVIVEFGPSHLARAGTTIEAWLERMLRPGFKIWEIDEVSTQLRPLRPIADLERAFSVNLFLSRLPLDHCPELASPGLSA